MKNIGELFVSWYQLPGTTVIRYSRQIPGKDNSNNNSHY